MSKWKEVWYVWDVDVDPVPEGYIFTAIDEEGDILWWTSGEIKTHMKELKLGMHAGTVVSFTRGEKRRRCVCKKGKGVNRFGVIIDCPKCNSTGWEYKK